MLARFATLVLVATPSVAQRESVEYGRDVRPILAAKCFQCHGPDAAQRKAELRLDRREAALAAGVFGDDDEASPLVERLFHGDPDERMPPRESGIEMTDAERDTLRRWVAQGAPYEAHWAFSPPARVDPPGTRDAAHPIDAFTFARMREHGLEPSPAASRRTLIRRASLDLTGLPPTLDEVDAFLADTRPGAFERVVDRLLQSPRFGEHMVMPWLDAARYADSNGYQHDADRYAWPWRDWMIRSLNANRPLDQMVVAMLAGDLLEEPTQDDLVATAFNRHHAINQEGGAIPQEVRFNYVVDRANVAATVFLGLTMGCAQCHDHKYDPISQREYYEFFAYFDNVEENGHAGPSRHNRYHQFTVAKPFVELANEEQKRDLAAARTAAKEAKGGYDKVAGAIGKAEAAWMSSVDVAALETSAPRIASAVLKRRGTPLTGPERRMVRAFYVGEVAGNEDWRQRYDAHRAAQERLAILHETVPLVMVMRDRKGARRETRVHTRGAYDAAAGEPLTPGIPAALGTLPDDAPANRLGLARWIVDSDNPLFARVMVNRMWQAIFGRGLVATAADFGATGRPPSHPRLLDWLATRFVESGFDQKALYRLLVTSATYRQSARISPKHREVDPDGVWLSRSSRHRLSSAVLRDQALFVAGMLDGAMFGPPVYPYHPEGLWADVSFEVFAYPHGRDGDQHRRSLYGFWRRTVAPPNMFDSANRLDCVVEPVRTNSPLHALTMLNETGFVEAARGVATRAMRFDGSTRERAAQVLRWTLAREPREQELELLVSVLVRERDRYAKDRAATRALVEVGRIAPPKDIEFVDLAAWTVVAQLVLNLDEVLCRP